MTKEMIQANELRIGNIVSYNSDMVIGKHVKVGSIENTTRSTGVRVYNGISSPRGLHLTGIIPFSDIEPIPLTEEILLKCGFEKIDDMVYYPDKKIRSLYINTLILRINTCSNLFEFHFQHRVSSMYENVEVKSLHQLQNLFHALTSKELEVEL